MRILHLVGRSHRRGAELVASELAEELDGLGHHDTLLALGLGHQGAEEPGLRPLVRSPRQHPGVLVLAAWRLRRELRARPVDVILAHGGSAAQVAALALPRGGPLVVWQRILGFPASGLGRLRTTWWRLVLRRIDATVALTEELADEVRRLGHQRPIWIIPNARRPDRFVGLDRTVASARLRDDLEVGPDTDVMGFVGHLVAQKRPERAVEVAARLRDLDRPVHLVVVGDGPLAADVVEAVHRLGLEDRVTLTGHRPDVEHVLAGIDLLLLTSDQEGIPGIAIEAQMSGCPVVSFPVGGAAEVVAHGVTGVVLDRFDVDDMASAAAALLADHDALAAMGGEARRRSQRFTMAEAARSYERHLTDALARRDGRGQRPADRGSST